MESSLLRILERLWTLSAPMSDANPRINERSYVVLLKKSLGNSLILPGEESQKLGKDIEKFYSLPVQFTWESKKIK